MSSTQMINRSSDDQRAYSPNRDVAYLFPHVMTTVASWLTYRDFPELDMFLKENEASPETLGRACQKFCMAFHVAATKPGVSCSQAIADSGFREEKVSVQMAVLACFGAAFAGIHHTGVRDAMFGGTDPLKTLHDFSKDAAETLDVLARQESVIDVSKTRGLLCLVEQALSKAISALMAFRVYVRRHRIR